MAREIFLPSPQEIVFITPRDFVATLFQHRRLVLWTFTLVFGCSLLYAIVQKPIYRSQMTILINLERTDPVVTPSAGLVQYTVPRITDQDINSELELLRSHDLLRDAAVASGLDSGKDTSSLPVRWMKRLTGAKPPSKSVQIARAAQKLQSNLSVEVIPKSSLIKLTYASPDPELSAKVLKSISDLYVSKHLAMRRPAGTFDFFKRETDEYRAALGEAEANLLNFSRTNHIASVEAEKQTTLKKLADLTVAQHETEASIAVTKQRIQTLQIQMAELPSRMTTQVRTARGRAPDQLQATLLTLQLKRTELLGIFQLDYPEVKEVEKQIAEATAALNASQERSLIEETTDQDPAREWLRNELEKAKVDLVDLRSRDKANAAMLAQLSNEAMRLNELDVSQSELVRSVKLADEGYMAYQKKKEEARMSDALDRQRILNVAVADQPSVPISPANLSSSLILIIGLFSALVVSGSVAFGAERMSASFRTPAEVQRYLDIPVVAGIPDRVE